MTANNLTPDLIEHFIFSSENKLKIFRQYSRLEITELSQLANIDVSYLNQLENSRIDTTNPDVLHLCSLMNIDEDLVKDSSLLISGFKLRLLNKILNNKISTANLMLEQILRWLSIILYTQRKHWENIRQNSIAALRRHERKEEAYLRGKSRDKHYAPFRTAFKNIQKQKFEEYSQSGKKLTANSFVLWFLKNIPSDIQIPYQESNKIHKLTRLAQENNREFRNQNHS